MVRANPDSIQCIVTWNITQQDSIGDWQSIIFYNSSRVNSARSERINPQRAQLDHHLRPLLFGALKP